MPKLRALSRMQEGAYLPALAMTGFASKQDHERAAKAGFDAHVAKEGRQRTNAVVVTDGIAEGRRGDVSDISTREVVVALLAHLGLPPFAPSRARARSPAVELS